MSDTELFTNRLTAILDKVVRWRKDADVIRALAEKVAASRAVSEQQLLSVEQISTAVYSEIPSFDKIVAEHGAPTELEAAMVTHVGDALRLLSLELTELSTKMYAAHSAWALDDGTRSEPAELPEDSVWR
jgi:hypothetical protein